MKFFYQAKTSSGETKVGVLEARDKHEVARVLHDQGLLLISATEEGGKPLTATTIIGGGILGGFFSVPLVEKMMFARHLAVMIGAGLSLNRALAVLAEQSTNQKFKGVIIQISGDIEKGKSFGVSLEAHPHEFNDLFVNMVKVGEESGNLEGVLKILEKQMRKEHQLKSRVRGAMLYPIIIVTAMVGIGILMMIMVIPKLSEVFDELGVPLPITTRIVIGIGKFLAGNVILVILSFPGFFVLMRYILNTKAGKHTMDLLLLRVPPFAGITKKVNSARFARTLGSLIESGVPIVRALEIISGTLTNHYYRESILQSAERVRKGEELHKGLQAYSRLYPPLVVQMIAVGEETGALSDIMGRLAAFYEDEVNTITKSLSTVVEPVLMIIIGIAVGFFAVSMIQPMYGMMNSI